jgi:MFS transporter, SET family, sugar efflux transporter
MHETECIPLTGMSDIRWRASPSSRIFLNTAGSKMPTKAELILALSLGTSVLRASSTLFVLRTAHLWKPGIFKEIEHRFSLDLQALLRTPFFLPITIAVLFIGAADAVGGSYLTLFAVDQGHMNPLELGIFLATLALSGIAVSAAFGRWFDNRPSVVPVFLTLVTTTVGYLFLTATTRFYLLLLIACGPLATSLAAFPQLFALAKGHLDQVGGDTAEGGIAMIRGTWSIAWAIGPALGALIVGQFDFRGVFMTSALCASFAILSLVSVRVPVANARKLDSRSKLTTKLSGQIWFAASSLVLFHMAMFMGSIALPILNDSRVERNQSRRRADF